MSTLRLAVLLVVCAAPLARADLSPNHKVATLQAAMREQWVEHIFWVREAARATLRAEPAEATAAEQEVLGNLKQLAKGLEPFYGPAAGEKLFVLLNGHWSGIQAHVRAVKQGDLKAQQDAMKRLNANADAIAAFLASANPNLPKDVLTPVLYTHAGHHGAQDLQLNQKAYADEARTWDAMRRHVMALADTLGAAIGTQFPEKFKEAAATR